MPDPATVSEGRCKERGRGPERSTNSRKQPERAPTSAPCALRMGSLILAVSVRSHEPWHPQIDARACDQDLQAFTLIDVYRIDIAFKFSG
jgi:hypothetical protein